MQQVTDKDLLEWVKSNGAKVERVAIGNNSQGVRGVLAETSQQSVNMLFPESILLTKKYTSLSNLIKKGKSHNIISHDDDCLPLFILEESLNPDSFWSPYIRTLPQDISSFPQMLSDQELAMLGDSGFRRKVDQHRIIRRSEYKHLCKIPGFEFSEKEYYLACIQVDSRAFTLRAQEGRLNRVLVPFFDMMNHSSVPDPSSWYCGPSAQNDSFRFSSSKKYQAGEEIHIRYANPYEKCFEITYGFTDDIMNTRPDLTAGHFIVPRSIFPAKSVEPQKLSVLEFKSVIYASNYNMIKLRKDFDQLFEELCRLRNTPAYAITKHDWRDIGETLIESFSEQRKRVLKAPILDENAITSIKKSNPDKRYIYDMMSNVLAREAQLLSFLADFLQEQIDESKKGS